MFKIIQFVKVPAGFAEVFYKKTCSKMFTKIIGKLLFARR